MNSRSCGAKARLEWVKSGEEGKDVESVSIKNSRSLAGK
jgi:uncharacterized OB-fold protein